MKPHVLMSALGGLVGGFLLAAVFFVDPWGFRSGMSSESDLSAEANDQLWTCGMHPHVIQKEPGTCPICQMDLTPMGAGESAPQAGGEAVWVCPMHSDIVESESGSCPICGMDLVQKEVESSGDGTAVYIDPSVVQNMNVRTAVAERRDLRQSFRTVGSLDFDQERMVTVTTKYSGWIEKVFVNYIGESVKKGQPLFEIYSPELVQTEQELLSALDFARNMEGAPEDSRQRAEALAEAARVRLGYWDISAEQIKELEQSRQVFRTLTVTAPSSGVVMKRMESLEGMAVKPGMALFHLADLSSLWLSVEIFENQIAWIRQGTQAEISFPYFPGKTFRGKVRYIEPEMAEKTRTLRVRIEVPNRRGELRKGMFATVIFEPLVAPDAVAVPSQAILRTGRQHVVVVAQDNGHFAPRQVVVGLEAEGYSQILEGLEEGEELVTSAQFLLDSESQLREAIQKMMAREH